MHYNSNAEAAEQGLKKLRELGVKAIAVQGNAGSTDFSERLVKSTLEAFPGRSIDIIVNNAAHAVFSEGMADLPVEEFDLAFQANVRGPLLLVQAALPHLTSPGARIINIGTVVARVGTKYANLYAASKAALNTLTVGMSDELAARGITANVVAPGPIDTDRHLPEEHPLSHKFRATQHIKRNGTVEEVTALIAFIASSGSSFITGQVIGVDGGMSYI